MASQLDIITPLVATKAQGFSDAKPTTASLLTPAVAFLQPTVQAPFEAIRRLFDHLRADSNDAALLNSIYPVRGIFKTASTHNPSSDQKLTIDLSPTRASLIPTALHASLASHGLDEIISFFSNITATYMPTILSGLSTVAGADLIPLHKSRNINFRICDYTPSTADPNSTNGCGAHTDYGTFAIIFQDGQAGLEAEAPDAPGTWVPVPGDATVVVCGWCALLLSGGRVQAVKHRVRRTPGVRRLSAVLFVAPDLDVVLKPANFDHGAKAFSDSVMAGKINVKWFKEVMGKRWRWREGNEALEEGETNEVSQDEDIEKLIWK